MDFPSDKRIEILDYCWCDNPIEAFDKSSEHEIIIRRYVGQHGHLVDVAFHPACYILWATMDLELSRKVAAGFKPIYPIGLVPSTEN